jgi:RNA methyltransferase, TrmH family
MISEIISSPNNRWIKSATDLATSTKARKKSGLMFLEGMHLCEAFLQSGLSEFPSSDEVLLIGQDYFESANAQSLLAAWQDRNGKVVMLLDKLFGTITQVENGPAIAMIVLTPMSAVLQDWTQPKIKIRDIVYLDGLQDPGNAGTILRTAAACGLTQVYASPTTVSLWSPKVLRAAMGAHFHLQIAESVSIDTIFEAATGNKASIFVTTGQATKTLFDSNLKVKSIWVLGNEGQGVNVDDYSLAKARSHTEANLQFLKIPQQGVESLNVASAAAVCFYEQWRQRQPTP